MAACGSSCVNKGNKGNSGLPEQHQRRGRAAAAARAGYSGTVGAEERRGGGGHLVPLSYIYGYRGGVGRR